MFKIGDKVRYTGKSYGDINKEIGVVVGNDGYDNIVHYPNVKNNFLHDCYRFDKNEYLYLNDCNLELINENKGEDTMFKVGDKVEYVGDSLVKELSEKCVGEVVEVSELGTWVTVHFPDLKLPNRQWVCLAENLLLLSRDGDDDMKIKIGSKVEYDGAFYDLLWGETGIVKKIKDKLALVYYPDLEEEEYIGDEEYLHDNVGEYDEYKYAWLDLEDLILIDNGGDSMKKIIVTGDTGDYHKLPMGTMLDVTSEGFGYVNTPSGRIKDVDYVVYSDKMLVKIMDLRDIIKATGAKFRDDEGLYYPDGKLLLSGQNQEHIGKTFNVLKMTDKQIVIGNPKVRICFGKSEIGKAIKLIQG